MLFTNQIVKTTAYLTPALAKWKLSLETAPWYEFKQEMFSMCPRTSMLVHLLILSAPYSHR